MSPNVFLPHVVVLPEDKATREIANGFKLALEPTRQFSVLPIARGWPRVVEEFESEEIRRLRDFPGRHVILLIDFDEDEQRFRKVQERIPIDVKERVFVLGSWSDAERLEANLGKTCEEIGYELKDDCQAKQKVFWTSSLLRHNVDELNRLHTKCARILFTR